MRLDSYDSYPSGMKEYLSSYGWHFSKKMCEWAVSKMKSSSGMPIHFTTKEEVDALIKRCGVQIKNDNGYDAVFAYHMAKADYWGSSITDDQKLAKFIKDYLDDPDGYEEIAFTRFYADCIGKGVVVTWEDLI